MGSCLRGPRIDHVTTYVETEDVTEELERYRRAGFAVGDQVVAHAHGVRSGSIRFGSTYLELLAVADLDAFEQAPLNDRIVYVARRPFAIGLGAPDVDALAAAWRARDADLAVTTLDAVDDRSGAPLTWKLLVIPLKSLRGASCFVVERPAPVTAVPADNATYAVAGVTLVSAEHDARAAQWRGLLEADLVAGPDPTVLALGPQRVVWISPERFAARFGRPWQPTRHPLGELAAIHLLSDDLDRTRAALGSAGWTWAERVPAEGAVFVEPPPGGGFALAIHAWPRSAGEPGALELVGAA
jgi:hypothetical protein